MRDLDSNKATDIQWGVPATNLGRWQLWDLTLRMTLAGWFRSFEVRVQNDTVNRHGF
jgi:hypothetical protein